ncbi:MAG: hypothetical protein ACI8XB_001046 [Patiriisocius sp.]|jgi:hypothetical protein
MIKPFKTLLIGAAILCLGITSCSKDDDDDEPETSVHKTSEDTTPTFQFESGDGFCAAVISTTSFLESISGISFDIEFGTAVAGFTYDNWTSFINVAGVSCEMQTLDNQPNESYVHTYTCDPLAPNDLGITFDGNPSWIVNGANGVPTINYTTSIGFPDLGAVTGAAIVDRTHGVCRSYSFC